MSINFGGLGSPVKEIEGGTNASTFDQARTNLGVNPTFTSLTLTYNAVAADRGKYFHYTGAGGVDFTLTAAATLTSTWSCFLRNDAAANITINPSGAELINGAATLAIEPGVCVEIFCSGTGFFTLGQAAAVDGANINLSNLGLTAINAALLPSADNTRDLGTTALGWRDIYTRTVVSPVTGGLALAVWDTGTSTYKAILGSVVGNPATAVIADFVTGTTQPPATNNTTLATTAFVQTAVTAGAGAPTNATYITQTPNGSLTNEQALSLLGTGLLKSTTGTGIVTIGINGTDFYGPGTPTPIPVTDGGTGVATLTTAFGTVCAGTTATGPLQTVAPGTTGLPLVSAGAAALPSYSTLTVAGGGTGRTTSTTAFGTICAGTTATGPLQTVAPGTSGLPLVSAGAAALPSYATLTVAGGGTGRTTSTTAFGTICAGTTATGALQTVAPGTSGFPLVSAGAAALPSYSALTVAGGGTGVTTLTTPFGVLCAGTTATGAVQTLPSLGTAGQVLTSNGAGLLPSFQSNPAGSGSMVFIAAATAAGSATIDFTAGITSTYDQYILNFSDVIPATNNVGLWVRLQSGGVFRSTAADYAWVQSWYTTAASGFNNSSDTKIELASTGARPLANTSTKGASGTLYLGTPANTATHKRIWGTYTYWETLVVGGSFGGWLVGVTTAVTGIQFLMSTGNITSGTFQLYGIRKS